MKRTNTFNIKVIFILAALVLIALSVFSFIRMESMIGAAKWQNHSNVVKLELETVFSIVKDAESSQRAFILTEDSVFYHDLYTNINNLDVHLNNIDSLVNDNPVQIKNAALLRSIAYKRIGYLKLIANNLATAKNEIERYIGGKVYMDEFINQIAKMTNEENGLLVNRTASLKEGSVINPMLILFLFLSTVIILIAGYYRVMHDFRITEEFEEEREKANKVLEEKNKLLERSEERLLTMFDNNPVALSVAEIGTGKIVYANKQFYNTFGLMQEEVIGHKSDDLKLTSDEENARLIPIIMSYIDDGRSLEELQNLSVEETEKVLMTLRLEMFKNGYEIKYTRKNGETFFAMVYFEIIETGANKYTITSYLDVNERKMAEEKIAATSLQLSKAQLIAHIGSFEMNWITKEITLSEEMYNIYGLEQGSKVDFEVVNKMNIDADNRMKMVQEALKEKKPFHYEGRIINYKNELKIMDVNAEVICDENGNPYKVTGIAQDITERKLSEDKIAETARQLSEAQEIAHIGSWETDLKLNKIKWSDEVYRIYGFESGEIALSYDELTKYVYSVDHDKINTILTNAVIDKKPFNFDYSIITRNKEIKILNTLGEVEVDENGNPVKLVGTIQDVTERVLTINKLHETETKAKAKQQFLSNMSHEIRTPMNSIIGFANVLMRMDLTKEQKQYVSAIQESGDALLVIINDILDIAKVDAGKMTFEKTPFNLIDSVSSTLLMLEGKMQEKNLELVKEYDNTIPEIILGDPVRLRQIILNLLSNAVKFTETGRITVSVQKLNEDKEKITLEFNVTDTGIGIPKDKIDTIFESFEQASNETSKIYGGTGLGLAIIKKLVELQGGTIKVSSKLGEGSSFGFVMSFEKTDIKIPARKEKKSYDRSGIKNVKVLVAEDNKLNQLLIKIKLKQFGFDADIVANGKSAIEKLKENKYDVILMDIQMPEMNGFEATKCIRNEMKLLIPIIALTADVTSTDIENYKVIGMNDYLSKPIDEELLYSKIALHLNKDR